MVFSASFFLGQKKVLASGLLSAVNIQSIPTSVKSSNPYLSCISLLALIFHGKMTKRNKLELGHFHPSQKKKPISLN